LEVSEGVTRKASQLVQLVVAIVIELSPVTHFLHPYDIGLLLSEQFHDQLSSSPPIAVVAPDVQRHHFEAHRHLPFPSLAILSPVTRHLPQQLLGLTLKRSGVGIGWLKFVSGLSQQPEGGVAISRFQSAPTCPEKRIGIVSPMRSPDIQVLWVIGSSLKMLPCPCEIAFTHRLMPKLHLRFLPKLPQSKFAFPRLEVALRQQLNGLCVIADTSISLSPSGDNLRLARNFLRRTLKQLNPLLMLPKSSKHRITLMPQTPSVR
jgi:hypothetical protein